MILRITLTEVLSALILLGTVIWVFYKALRGNPEDTRHAE